MAAGQLIEDVVRETWTRSKSSGKPAWLAPVPPGVGMVAHEQHRQAPDGQASVRHADAPVLAARDLHPQE